MTKDTKKPRRPNAAMAYETYHKPRPPKSRLVKEGTFPLKSNQEKYNLKYVSRNEITNPGYDKDIREAEAKVKTAKNEADQIATEMLDTIWPLLDMLGSWCSGGVDADYIYWPTDERLKAIKDLTEELNHIRYKKR